VMDIPQMIVMISYETDPLMDISISMEMDSIFVAILDHCLKFVNSSKSIRVNCNLFDIFLRRNPRVPCNSYAIPSLDLTLWTSEPQPTYHKAKSYNPDKTPW
jgi:hypothetical protein